MLHSGAWGVWEVSLRKGPQRPFQNPPQRWRKGRREGGGSEGWPKFWGPIKLLLMSCLRAASVCPPPSMGGWDIPDPEPCWYSKVKPRPSFTRVIAHDETVNTNLHIPYFASSSNSLKNTQGKYVLLLLLFKLPSHVRFFATPWKAACQASLSLTDLLQDNTVKVLVAQSRLTLCNPMDSSPPGSSVHGILQARILE